MIRSENCSLVRTPLMCFRTQGRQREQVDNSENGGVDGLSYKMNFPMKVVAKTGLFFFLGFLDQPIHDRIGQIPQDAK
jgi:hypothetical protein